MISKIDIFSIGLISFAIVAAGMPALIKFFKDKKETSLIRELGPDHSQKVGTPTMGGLLFVSIAVLASLLASLFFKTDIMFMILIVVPFLAYGIIGGIDDYIKLANKATEGFKFKPKLLAQTLAALVVYLLMIFMNHKMVIHISLFYANLTFTFTGIFTLIYLAFIWFWFVGWSNATNLTDGLDGLMSGLGIIIYAGYAHVAYNHQEMNLAIFDIAVVGALIGFWIFNKPKAKIFMGDTGSLALGAGLAMNSIMLNAELSLLWFGLIFVIETLSVIIQTISYHYFKKRIFPMAPIHHSFEMYNWSEWKIDILFWTIAIIQVIIALVIWK